MSSVKERFLKYVAFNTTSDENNECCPSTEGQISFGKVIVEELKKIGIEDVTQCQNGYIYATIQSNVDSDNVPAIGFVAHMDTSPDALGENVKPVVTENYGGEEIKLNGVVISPAEFPSLKSYIGDDIITSDGNTLLGADDKAGIAEILAAAEYITKNHSIKHGKICIAFTPDEEIGRGADLFDVKKFGADFAYTIDGGRIGELEYENFNAAVAKFIIKGKSVHPGTAKGVMINAGNIASEIVDMFPKNETPSTTEGYDGFYHLTSIKGSVGHAEVSHIIRDFDNDNFEKRKKFVKSIADKMTSKYGNIIELNIKDQYKNMFEIIKGNIEIVERAKKAMLSCGVEPIIQPIRGGTDGARLSFMGLPCPNIFAGGHNFHGNYEYIPVSSMEKAVEVIINIVRL